MKLNFAKIKEFWHKLFFWHTPMHEHAEFMPEAHHDHDLVLQVAGQPRLSIWKRLVFFRRLLDATERRTFTISLLAFLVFAIGGVVTLILPHLETVPAFGGVMTQAVIGSPKLINPIYVSLNDVDRDLASLIYSGLFRLDESLEPQPDLADSFHWSADGKVLEIHLRPDALFHDGVPVTADDIVTTYQAVKNSDWHSPVASNYKNITAVIRVDDQTVQFQLQKPQPNILADLTLGILPAHLWNNVKDTNATLAELNIKPVGSGPYHVLSFTRDNQGSIIMFRLEAFSNYYGFKPLIQELDFRFYPSQDEALQAVKNEQADALAFVPWKDLEQTKVPSVKTIALDLPRESILFFNTKDSLLKDERLRSILVRSLDHQELQSLVGNHASLASTPFPFLTLPASTSTATSTTSTAPLTIETGRQALEALGWKLGAQDTVRSFTPPPPPTTTRSRTRSTRTTTATATTTVATVSSTQLALTIDVPDEPDLINVADLVKRRWSLLGAKVDVRVTPFDDLYNQSRLNKDYQIILWNVLLPANQDISKFWGSDEVGPGLLNWSNLADRDVDHALELVDTATSTDAILNARLTLSRAIMARSPAAFLLRPSYAYLVNNRVGGTHDLLISRPSDRLTQASTWYVKTRWVWN